jgi:hypothetical protein
MMGETNLKWEMGNRWEMGNNMKRVVAPKPRVIAMHATWKKKARKHPEIESQSRIEQRKTACSGFYDFQFLRYCITTFTIGVEASAPALSSLLLSLTDQSCLLSLPKSLAVPMRCPS